VRPFDVAPLFDRDGGRRTPRRHRYSDVLRAACSKKAAFEERGEHPLTLLDDWLAQWRDLVHFEVVPVLSSTEVQAQLAERL
jgi:hypothetical protein